MSPPPLSHRARRILAIADDERLRGTLARALNRFDFEVVAVSTESAAKVLASPAEAADEATVDAVLLDVPAGPGAGALAALGQLRALGHDRRTLCLVAPWDSRALEGWRLAGILLKPIDVEELAFELGRVARVGAMPEDDGPKGAA